MKTIHVCASRNYDIHIGAGIIEKAADYISTVKSSCTVAIISNNIVAPIYMDKLTDSLEHSGYQVISHVIPDGECFKNHTTYFEILTFLTENQITRGDLLIALGGGVVGDITGFVAATYLRGVEYVQIPTSLLAMVDSSVGGKTAIDMPQGKNLVGAFYQPIMVLCDLNALNTLPTDVFIDGCAEVIKYGMLFDEDLFSHLNKSGQNFDREYVVHRCVELKRDVVSEDEFDTGLRQKLNLGHTIGHAIEKVSNFTVSHGRAVGMGMAIITKAATKIGICSSHVYEDLISVLNIFQLNTQVPNQLQYTADRLFDAALSDKKRCGGTVNLIIPEEIGNCSVRKTELSQLKIIIESGL